MRKDGVFVNDLRCIAAYTTFDRFSGKCGLLILWEKRALKKELEMHSFLLSFNYEGIKKYTLKKLTLPHRQDWEEELAGYVRIDFAEAVSLLQDAYKQNVRFGTVPAAGWEKYSFFLESESGEIDQVKLLQKMSSVDFSPVEFTNIYLAALKRMDNAVLYDLSSPERKKRLGSRAEFLLYSGDSLSAYTFLKSKVLVTEKRGKRQIVTAFIVVSTPEDEIMEIAYNLVLLRRGKVLSLDGFQEVSRTVLTAEHPENPLNYRVFCSTYHLSHPALVRGWLESSPDVFLTGEFEGGICYKLLKPEEIPHQSFDVASGIISEFLLTENELFIYAQKPFHLAKMERSLVQALQDKVSFKQKYYLPVRKLYQAALQGVSLESLLEKSPERAEMHSFSALSAFLLWQGYGKLFDKLKREALYKLQLDSEAWYFFIERKKRGREESSGFIEYYLSGNWLRLNVYNGRIGEEIKKLGARVEVIKEDEFASQSDSLNVPLSEERQWKIFKMLNLMGREAPSLKAMGLIPSVRGMARRLGTLVQ